MKTSTPRLSATLLAVLASTLVLAACDRNDRTDSPTVGQQVDQSIVTAERKSGEIAADVREAGRDARQAAGEAADTLANKSKDMAITAEVNTRLARDTQLSALQINVDTAAGRVVLRGSAPDTDARARATELARGVDGVVAVDNELNVQPPQARTN
jgi:hyperosmotically inducible periplasmic protein